MAKHTTITVETDSLLVLRGRRTLRAWCLQCGGDGEVVPLYEVSAISNLTPQQVEAWIDSEDLHHIQTPDGVHLICLNSMLKRVHKTTSASRQSKQV